MNYQNNEDFAKDREALIKRLESAKPFDEFMDALGIWYLDINQKEEMDFFKEAEGIPPLKVRQKFLDDIMSRLKSNYKLIIIDALGSVSCAELSSRDKLSLIILGRARYTKAQSFAKGFLHELGHSWFFRN